jgi:hypothetical protein
MTVLPARCNRRSFSRKTNKFLILTEHSPSGFARPGGGAASVRVSFAKTNLKSRFGGGRLDLRLSRRREISRELLSSK